MTESSYGWRDKSLATHRVKRGGYRGTSSALPDCLEDGTLLRRFDLQQHEWPDAASQVWVSSVGKYVVIGGEHAGMVVTLGHSHRMIESGVFDSSGPQGGRMEPGPAVEEHPDLERL